MHHEITAALISSGGAILAALIASVAATLIGRKVLKNENLEKDLKAAIRDVHFLLEVERRHCEIHVARGDNPNLRIVRKYVLRELKMNWTGRFTPGREGRSVASRKCNVFET